MAEHWFIQGVIRNPHTGETKDTGGERSVPAALGARLVRRGDWRKLRTFDDGNMESQLSEWTERGPQSPEMPKPRSTKGAVPPGAVLNG